MPITVITNYNTHNTDLNIVLLIFVEEQARYVPPDFQTAPQILDLTRKG